MIPSKVEKCPLIDAVVEIRFTSKLFPSAVFGIIYNEFKNDYPNVEKLPILQIPDQLREIDPNFKFKPHYKLFNEKFIVQIGSDVISISSTIPYVGWEEYSNYIFSFYERLFKIELNLTIIRLGVRYVNFFENDIFEKVNLSLSIGEFKHEYKNTHIRTEISENGFSNIVQIANNAKQIINGKTIQGSVIDIDTFKDYSDNSFIIDFRIEVSKAHTVEKKLFFSLLKEDFILTLKPIYNE